MIRALFYTTKLTTRSFTLSNQNNLSYSYFKNISPYLYSVAKNHPTIQKIIDGSHINNIDALLTEIGGLNDKNREIALKLVLKDIYSHKLSTKVISNPKFTTQAIKSP